MAAEISAPVSSLSGHALLLPVLFKRPPCSSPPFPPLAAHSPRRNRARTVAPPLRRRRRAPVRHRRRSGLPPHSASPPSASPRRRRPRPRLRFARRPSEHRRPRRPEPRRRLLPFRPPFPSSPSTGVSRRPLHSLPPSLLSPGCRSAAPVVAGGDHRGAGASPSRRPCRRGRLRARPRGCQVGPAVSRPCPRVRLTRGTHGAGRRQPRAPGPPWTERLTRGPHSRGPGPRALSPG
ncbi:zinc knuckle containing protein-like [Oryza sativa Japonica Group]|uniref:Zinc knuckle containing protein-like n=1 Tax=Oryza sativa subsp. japonica TaxID=39947 RepID=Q5JJX9_ORYSJ|nr:zinc knuckle containing protein-like [Oryza sativa Japonica Group]